MILEVAQIDIRAGEALGFEEAMERALSLLTQSKGFRRAELFRSHEFINRYRLMVTWDDIESHLIDWQKSDAFKTWRNLLQSYFAVPPCVEHMTLVRSHPS